MSSAGEELAVVEPTLADEPGLTSPACELPAEIKEAYVKQLIETVRTVADSDPGYEYQLLPTDLAANFGLAHEITGASYTGGSYSEDRPLVRYYQGSYRGSTVEFIVEHADSDAHSTNNPVIAWGVRRIEASQKGYLPPSVVKIPSRIFEVTLLQVDMINDYKLSQLHRDA